MKKKKTKLRTAEYTRALKHVVGELPPKRRPLWLRILLAHYNARGHRSTAERLATKVGCASHHATNSHYGKFAHRLLNEMGILEKPKKYSPRGAWLDLLVDLAGHDEETGHLVLVLNKQMVTAVRGLKLSREGANV